VHSNSENRRSRFKVNNHRSLDNFLVKQRHISGFPQSLERRKGAKITSQRGKRLHKEVITFIKAEKLSYTKIQEKVEKRWGIKIAKSTVGYYKRQKPRIKAMHLEAISQGDWHWLQGLFSADGNKTISKDKYGKHYIVRISLDKQHDYMVAEKCIRIIKAIGLTPSVFSEGNCTRVKISSKLLFNALSKRPMESNLLPAYIAGAIDGDGWIDKGAIQFGQSHVPELFDALVDFFSKLGTPVKQWSSKDKSAYRRMYIPYSIIKSSGVLPHSVKAQNIQ